MNKAWLLLIPLLALFAGPAAAEVTACKEVKTVPFVIKGSGIWCLKKHLTYTGAAGQAIKIRKSNVVLDLNGFTLSGNAGPSSTANGVFAPNRSNITIRNGTIQGFERGIYLDDTSGNTYGHLVEYIKAIGNYFTGIQVEGEGLVVRKNQVHETGDGDNSFNAYGIYLNNPRGAHIHDNTVTKTSETTNARGIVVIGGSEVIIRQNVVTDLRNATARFGVHVQSVNTASVYANQILSVASTTGIRALTSTDVSCFNNVIDGFNNTHSTCDNFTGNLP